MKVELSELKVGHAYYIEFDDCCVKGELAGIFLGWDKEWDGTIDSLTSTRALFNFGEIEGWAWHPSLAEV